MIRVLHVMHNLERSGMEMMLLNSSNEWERRNYQFDVLATANDVGLLVDEMKAAGYGVIHLPFRSSMRYLPNRRFLSEFYQLCVTRNYDILHIHTEAATPIFVLAAHLAAVGRIVLSVHNTYEFVGLLRLRKRLERALIRTLGGRYGMVSDAVRNCELDRFSNDGARIHNWIDTGYFRPPSLEERAAARASLDCDNKFVMISVANCNHAKNHNELIRAIPLIDQSHNLLYLHIGREHPDRPELAFAKQLNVESNVRFLGSQSDPRNFLWAADAFVMPSLYEGLGNSALEAIASGIPAVLTDVSGLHEIIAATNWTISVSPIAESLAEGLRNLATLPFESRRLRALEDSTRVRAKFSIAAGVDTMIRDLYSGSTIVQRLVRESISDN